MISKTITYTDFNDVEKTETFWFNFTESEFMKMEMELNGEGGLMGIIKKMAATNDLSIFSRIFETLIIKSYGLRTPDGLFIKNPEVAQNFCASAAYNELYMELLDQNKLVDFIKGTLPKKIREQIPEDLSTVDAYKELGLPSPKKQDVKE